MGGIAAAVGDAGACRKLVWRAVLLVGAWPALGCAPPETPERIVCRLADLEPAALASARPAGPSAPAGAGASPATRPGPPPLRQAVSAPPPLAGDLPPPHCRDGVPPAPRGAARAAIDDDTRYTFARSEFRLIQVRRDVAVADAPALALEATLPPALGGCAAVTARVTLVESAAEARRPGQLARATELTLGTCVGSPPASRIEARVPVPQVFRGGRADLWIAARPEPDQGTRERRFVLTPPPGARLALSYGVERPAWRPDAAPVRFRVRVEGAGAPVGGALLEARLDPAATPAHRRWFDASLDLAPWAGRSLTLVLETRVEPAPGRRPFSLPVWGNPTVLAPGAAPEVEARNVLLISFDTLRAKSVGAYGYERATSPFIDALAAEGTLFERAFAPSTTTLPSHMSLFTGLYPSTHGVTSPAHPSDLGAYATLAELLRRAGYATGAVTENGMLLAHLGFERGFDRYRENKSAHVMSPEGHIESTFAQAVEWMAEHGRVPFFLFVHTYQVHGPHTPPPGYRGRFGRADATGPEAARDRYDEEIRYADDQLARLWTEVRALGLADRTLLVVTSDHGEEFGEHGALAHGSHLYDETLGVPLIFRAPGLVPAGLRVPEQVGLIDVPPTVLDLLGLPPPSDAEGRSLAALLGGDAEARATLRRTLAGRRLYAEALGAFRVLVDGTVDEAWRPPTYALREAGWKLIWMPPLPPASSAGRFEAYDLARDPEERIDVAPGAGRRVAAGRRALERYAREGAPAEATASAMALAAPDPATAEKLRALGYVE